MSETGEWDELYVGARRALLDALDALGPHCNAVTLVGAQAIYVHTGEANLAVALFTKDADIVLNPEMLGGSPPIMEAMQRGGFRLTGQPGAWEKDGIPVDLMVPEALAGDRGRRGADLGTHGRRVARKARGLEGALVDRAMHELAALDPVDGRRRGLAVAGPGALLVAKIIKIEERAGEAGRLQDKDALDVLRLLRAVPARQFVASVQLLVADARSRPTTVEAIAGLERLFGTMAAPGSEMAARATEGVADPDVIRASCVALAHEILEAGVRTAVRA